MAKIQMVSVSCAAEGVYDVFLDIHFINGQTVILPLKDKSIDPEFAEIFSDGRLFSPHTDGEHIYWQNGPSLSETEILQMIRRDGG
ncbi:MAG: hypothetical protein VB078_04985 [Clostridiaceae bacterium]|nr:hypothetical protein [Clostridiaceae bacterium]